MTLTNKNRAETGWLVEAASDGSDWRATCETEPALDGIVWWWTPGTGQVEYQLAGGSPAGTVNVWDDVAGAASITTADELAEVLAERYRDSVDVARLEDF